MPMVCWAPWLSLGSLHKVTPCICWMDVQNTSNRFRFLWRGLSLTAQLVISHLTEQSEEERERGQEGKSRDERSGSERVWQANRALWAADAEPHSLSSRKPVLSTGRRESKLYGDVEVHMKDTNKSSAYTVRRHLNWDIPRYTLNFRSMCLWYNWSGRKLRFIALWEQSNSLYNAFRINFF